MGLGQADENACRNARPETRTRVVLRRLLRRRGFCRLRKGVWLFFSSDICRRRGTSLQEEMFCFGMTGMKC